MMDRRRLSCRNGGARLLVGIFFLLALPLSIVSKDYRTSTLRQAAATLGIERQIAKVGKGVTTQIVTPTGTTVIVRTDGIGTVEHIGLPLFHAAMRKQTPSPVYDCVEYAALDRCVLLTENDLLLQKIRFYKGSWQTLLGIQPSDACSITTQDKKYYQLTWSRNGRETVNMVIPINYELLSVCNRRELEKNFIRDVARHQIASKTSLSKDIDPQLAKAELHLDTNLSGYERQTINVTLRQWITYCESLGCQCCIKYDDSDETLIKGYLMSHNDAMGYHHLLELTWTMEDLSKSVPKIKGKALLFIPNNDKI